jgi:acyl-homoserine lactone acylase PvdQ
MHAGSEPYHDTPQLINPKYVSAGSDNKRQQQANRQ